MSDGWIGVDFDGTLAHYDSWGDGGLGEPIPVMAERVKTWLAAGHEVRIVTARVSRDAQFHERSEQADAIRAWCLRHLGQALKVTCEKDFSMRVLFDDRCVQVIKNTGEQIGNWTLESSHP